MINKKMLYALIFLPYFGTGIVTLIIFHKYGKVLGPIKGWFYVVFTTFPFLYLTVVSTEWLLPDYDENSIIFYIVFYFRFLVAGYLIIITHSFILKKYEDENR
jgi:hypothetical protein